MYTYKYTHVVGNEAHEAHPVGLDVGMLSLAHDGGAKSLPSGFHADRALAAPGCEESANQFAGKPGTRHNGNSSLGTRHPKLVTETRPQELVPRNSFLQKLVSGNSSPRRVRG